MNRAGVAEQIAAKDAVNVELVSLICTADTVLISPNCTGDTELLTEPRYGG